jgi:protein-tyrosine phosphatase
MGGPGTQGSAAADRPIRLLFVCTGNICRSPAAAVLAESLPGAAGLEISSAGTRAVVGAGLHRGTSRALWLRGLHARYHEARDITRELVERSDVVLTMTRSHRGEVLRLVPSAVRRTYTVKEFNRLVGQVEPEPASLAELLAAVQPLRAAVRGDDDVQDPVAGPDELHERVVEALAEELARPVALLSALAKRSSPEPGG